MKRRFMGQRAFNEARKVVYHSHHAPVLYSHWPDHTQSTEDFTFNLIGCGDYRTAFHGRRHVLSANYHLNIAAGLIAGHTLGENLDEP
jgi:hypothetical protein